MRTLLLSLGLCVATSAADAQHDRYQTVLIGERALGFGGAFTGIADDPSAAYYNPAGLAHINRGALSASLSVNAFSRVEVDEGYSTFIGEQDLVHKSKPTIPVFVAAVYKFGPRDEDRVRRHAIAISTFHPLSRDYRYTISAFNEASRVSEAIRIQGSDKLTWWGPSYAFRVSDSFALGMSAFLSRRSLRHEEDQTTITEGAFDPDFGTYRNDTLFVRESLAEVSARHLVFRLGVLWDATRRLRLGLMFQPPGIEVQGKSRISERRSFADLLADPGYATFFRSDQKGLEASTPIPWELRLGASYAVGAFIVSVDGSLYGPNGSESDPVSVLGTPEPDPVTLETPQPGDYLASSFSRRLSGNGSIGVEAVIADAVPVRAGFFTDFSAAPPLGNGGDVYAPPRIHGFGGALSVGVRTDGYDASIGVAGLFGKGRALHSNLEATGPTYVPTPASERVIYFFISGAMTSASRLAKNVVREHLRGDTAQ